jgi:hypothetical protein
LDPEEVRHGLEIQGLGSHVRHARGAARPPAGGMFGPRGIGSWLRKRGTEFVWEKVLSVLVLWSVAWPTCIKLIGMASAASCFLLRAGADAAAAQAAEAAHLPHRARPGAPQPGNNSRSAVGHAHGCSLLPGKANTALWPCTWLVHIFFFQISIISA